MRTPSVAIVHDYLTQRGGAERVVLSMLKAFPGATVYTSLYVPETTFEEFAEVRIHTLPINRLPALRNRHRLALPVLAPAFSALAVEADLVLCSSSGWAHAAHARGGRKVVYCHTPARWLYQPSTYMRGPLARTSLALLRPHLTRWDRRAAASADLYIAVSTVVGERIRSTYGIEPILLHPPPGIQADGPRRPLPGLGKGFFLCVSRLLPYKNVDRVVAAFRLLAHERLVVVGDGPAAAGVRRLAGGNVTVLPRVTDDELRYLYAECGAVIAASYEDFGLTPLEAACFGKPALALRGGGYVDTVVEGRTGFFFVNPTPEAIAAAVRRLEGAPLDPDVIRDRAMSFSERRFIESLRTAALGTSPPPRSTGSTSEDRSRSRATSARA